jgi:hypothetical protein
LHGNGIRLRVLVDEMYMLAIGRYHLDWGAADQPPLTPALAAFADAVAPGSLIALRLPGVLATAGAVVVAALIAREFYEAVRVGFPDPATASTSGC